MLPQIVPGFLKACPEIVLEIVAENGFVDILAAGCDAGIRYEEKLDQDIIAVPIGPGMIASPWQPCPPTSTAATGLSTRAISCTRLPARSFLQRGNNGVRSHPQR